jgi:hypothetical protein
MAIMRLHPMIWSAAFSVAILAGMATAPSAQAALGWFDQRNYMRCMEYATADAASMPAGPGRDAVYEASRKACNQNSSSTGSASIIDAAGARSRTGGRAAAKPISLFGRVRISMV